MSEPPRGAGSRLLTHRAWTTVGPLAVALLSLALSAYTQLEARRTPRCCCGCPNRVSIGQGADTGWLYLQPRCVSTGRTERAAVILDMHLEAEREGGAAARLDWAEQGAWDDDPVANELTDLFAADPGPLVVGPASPQQPLGQLVGPPGGETGPTA